MKSYKDDKSWKIFIKNIVWLREHYEFSKEKMAEISGISVEVINRIENGEMPDEVTVETIIRLGNFFCVEPMELFSENLGKDKWKI